MKGLILSRQIPLFGKPTVVGYDDGTISVVEMEGRRANEIIRAKHYSGTFYSGTRAHLGVYSGGALIGVLQWGYAMNPASGGSIVTGSTTADFMELNRMWLSPDAPEFCASRAISASVRYMRHAWPAVKWLQSFADERCGKWGLVYQAASFGFYGEHVATFWELDGEWFHNVMMTAKLGKQGKRGDALQARAAEAIRHDLRQFRYLKFIDPRWEKRCVLARLPYPKHYAPG